MKRPVLIFAGAFVLGEMLGLYQLMNGREQWIYLVSAIFLVLYNLMIFFRGISKIYMLVPLIFLSGHFWSVRNVHLPVTLPQTDMTVSGKIKWLTESEGGTSLYLAPNSLLGQDGILVYLNEKTKVQTLPVSGEKLAIGMEVQIQGSVESFPTARNPGEFDRYLYYAAKKIMLKMSAETLVINRYQGDFLKNQLYNLRKYFANVLEEICKEEDSELFKAILLGDKQEVSQDIKDLYQKSGIIHLLAISGLHISLLGTGFYKSLRYLGIPYFIACMLSAFLMISFAIMTGSSISVTRAVMMFTIHMAGDWLGRSYDMLTAMAISALLLFIETPIALISSGAQLSFMSILGIGIGSEAIKKTAVPGRLGESLAVSFGIQLFTLPISLFHFFEYPRYGIILNLLVIPLMPLVAASGVLGIFFGAFWPAAGTFFIGLGHGILHLYQLLSRLFLSLPSAVHTVGRPALSKVWVYYLILLLYLLVLSFINQYYPRRKFRCAVLPLTFFLLYGGLVPFLKPPQVKALEIRIIDVGQGDGILLRTPTGSSYLIDGGSSDVSGVGKNRIVPYLKYLGITEIDGVFLSHMDSDHINGISEILNKEDQYGIKIKALAVTAGTLADSTFKDRFQNAIKTGIPILELKAGDEIRIGEVLLKCFYPDNGGNYSSENDGSMVLHLEYGNFKALFTGDLEKDGELSLIKEGLGSYHILKVGHHGSKTSSNQSFLDIVQPEVALISAGANSRYGHPHEEVMERLCQAGSQIYMTPRDGAITLWTDGGQVWIESYLK